MTESFAQALQKRETPTVVDPRDGTVLDLTTEQHELLVDVLLELRRREAQVKDWRVAVEDELVRRHGDRRAAQVIGANEVDIDRGFSRVWDTEDLKAVVSDLVASQLLSIADVTGLLRVEEKVDGRRALQLLNRLQGEALAELSRCFEWEQRGRAKVKVTPVAELGTGSAA